MRRDIPLHTDFGPDPEALGARFETLMATDFGARPTRRVQPRHAGVLVHRRPRVLADQRVAS